MYQTNYTDKKKRDKAPKMGKGAEKVKNEATKQIKTRNKHTHARTPVKPLKRETRKEGRKHTKGTTNELEV